MTTKEIEEAKAWLASEQNYTEGLRILAAHSKNPSLIKVFQGHENRYRGKLAYEISKLVAMRPVDPAPVPKSVSTGAPRKEVTLADNLQGASPGDPNSPKIINRIIAEFSDLYKSRSMALSAMKKVPADSREESNQYRKILVDKVEGYSTRMDELNHYHEEYKTLARVPDELVLYPPKKRLQLIPEEYSKDTLVKARALLVKTLNRNNNMLSYQTINSQKVKNPMPAGPRRTNLMNRIRTTTIELAKINARIDGTSKIIAACSAP